MKRLFAGKVQVHYSTLYFQGIANEIVEMKECFEGQVNGLCGARMRNHMFLITGLHTGWVNVTVDFWDREPPLEDSWEEVVEVSYVVTVPEWTGIMEWGGSAWHPIELRRGRYRVRYCARNMDAGRRKDTRLSSDTEEPIDEYSLSFWFAPGAPDRVIRQTSETAIYWHQWADKITRAAGLVAPVPYVRQKRGGAMVLKAKRLHFVAPTYPHKALQEGLSGSVTVDFIVDVKGEPTELRIMDSNPPGVFDQAALEALEHWRYEPFLLEGVRTPIPESVVFRFDPQSA
jgi:TonB family protein